MFNFLIFFMLTRILSEILYTLKKQMCDFFFKVKFFILYENDFYTYSFPTLMFQIQQLTLVMVMVAAVF